MGEILCSTIINDASEILLDEGFDRWDRAYLFKAICDGQREIVSLKPDAYVSNGSVKLAAGTKQTITGLQLIRVVRNMGTNGQTPGPVIWIADRARFDKFNPYWHMAAESAEIQYYMYDEKDPKTWYCYPPQPTSNQGHAEIIQSITPPDIALGESPNEYNVAITLDDIYKNPLLLFGLHRAYCLDADNSPAAKLLATDYYNLFAVSLGRRDLVEKSDDPNAETAKEE
jgi:hypothetical protein